LANAAETVLSAFLEKGKSTRSAFSATISFWEVLFIHRPFYDADAMWLSPEAILFIFRLSIQTDD